MDDYQADILYAIQELKMWRPLPDTLDYMVSIANKLTEPRLGIFIVPSKPGMKATDALAGLDIHLDPTVSISQQIRAVIPVILRQKEYDVRERLPEGMNL